MMEERRMDDRQELPSPPILKRRDAAEYLGIGLSTLWKWEKEGLIPPPRHIGKNYIYWLKEELDAFLLSRPKADPIGSRGKGRGRPTRK